jgi:hypothetical protein
MDIRNLIANFERVFTGGGMVKDKLPEAGWDNGKVYADGRTNSMFCCYWAGYTLGTHE